MWLEVEVVSVGKFNDKSCRVVLALIRSGQTKVVAARASGLTVTTLNKWLKDSDKVAFRAEFDRAESAAEEDLVQRVQFHAQKDWKAAKWLLTHRYPHWQEEAKTSKDDRARLDELRIRKSELEVEFAELRLLTMKSTDGDVELLAVLNSPTLELPSKGEMKQPN